MRATLVSLAAAISVVSTVAWADGSGFSVTEDISFGELPRQTLDIYTPKDVTDDTPVLVYLFGGAFFRGDKTQAQSIGPKFAESGAIVVAPNYRVNTAFPNFIEDGAKAVAYAWRELRTSSGAPRHIIVSGWSSGAYIGAKVSYDGRYLEAEGVPSDAINGFIGLAGPYRGGLCAGSRCPNTFVPGTEADWPVVDFVDPDDPPMLLIHAELDRQVDIGNLEELAAAGQDSGIDVTTLIAERRTHMRVMNDMPVADTEVHSAVSDFIVEYTSQ